MRGRDDLLVSSVLEAKAAAVSEKAQSLTYASSLRSGMGVTIDLCMLLT